MTSCCWTPGTTSSSGLDTTQTRSAENNCYRCCFTILTGNLLILFYNRYMLCNFRESQKTIIVDGTLEIRKSKSWRYDSWIIFGEDMEFSIFFLFFFLPNDFRDSFINIYGKIISNTYAKFYPKKLTAYYISIYFRVCEWCSIHLCAFILMFKKNHVKPQDVPHVTRLLQKTYFARASTSQLLIISTPSPLESHHQYRHGQESHFTNRHYHHYSRSLLLSWWLQCRFPTSQDKHFPLSFPS